MDRDLLERVIAQVAGSYLSREIDRRWLDRVVEETAVGARLRALSVPEIRALELVLYSIVAYSSQSASSPSAIRVLVQTVLMDLPVELVNRLTRDARISSTDLSSVLEEMTDVELTELNTVIGRLLNQRRFGAASSEESRDQSAVGSDPWGGEFADDQRAEPQASSTREAARRVAEWRQRIRGMYPDKK